MGKALLRPKFPYFKSFYIKNPIFSSKYRYQAHCSAKRPYAKAGVVVAAFYCVSLAPIPLLALALAPRSPAELNKVFACPKQRRSCANRLVRSCVLWGVAQISHQNVGTGTISTSIVSFTFTLSLPESQRIHIHHTKHKHKEFRVYTKSPKNGPKPKVSHPKYA
jgi:hypothetical protein